MNKTQARYIDLYMNLLATYQDSRNESDYAEDLRDHLDVLRQEMSADELTQVLKIIEDIIEGRDEVD